MRQIHHWAALVFVAAIVLHLCRIFFTGAFRRAPRDQLAGRRHPARARDLQRLRRLLACPTICSRVPAFASPTRSPWPMPVVGTWIAFLLFGGEFPANDILSRLFVVHVLLIPAAIAGLLGAHLAILWRQKHTQFPGRGRSEDNVVGSRLWPTYAAKSIGLFAIVGGRPGLPRWRRADQSRSGSTGRSKPSAVSTAAQPDWYMGWIEGALRLMPPALVTSGPYTVSELFWPAVLLPDGHLRAALPVAVPRAQGHRRRRRAPPARPTERATRAHDARGGGPHLLRDAAARRRSGHLGPGARPVVTDGPVGASDHGRASCRSWPGCSRGSSATTFPPAATRGISRSEPSRRWRRPIRSSAPLRRRRSQRPSRRPRRRSRCAEGSSTRSPAWRCSRSCAATARNRRRTNDPRPTPFDESRIDMPMMPAQRAIRPTAIPK